MTDDKTEEEDYAIDLSDLSDISDCSDIEALETDGNAGGTLVETTVESNNFLNLLKVLKIDSFSSFDLEIDDIVKHPDFLNCSNLKSEELRELWDIHCSDCKNNNSIIENDNIIGKLNKIPLFQYINFLKSLKSVSFKFSKFFTDFNRICLKNFKNDVPEFRNFKKISESVSLIDRKKIYAVFLNFMKNDVDLHKMENFLKKFNYDPILLLNSKKFENFDIFFLDDDKFSDLLNSSDKID